ncbi:uncharacterized protein J3D65DRAFT_147905 [Phyllosticta citribraziliensis]|uniref:Uncharacterized protein n=1 Tax=Phyllosticta citribraziliensis TaxID=989973 RepID=A0ABR1L6V0_9PEZI
MLERGPPTREQCFSSPPTSVLRVSLFVPLSTSAVETRSLPTFPSPRPRRITFADRSHHGIELSNVDMQRTQGLAWQPSSATSPPFHLPKIFVECFFFFKTPRNCPCARRYAQKSASDFHQILHRQHLKLGNPAARETAWFCHIPVSIARSTTRRLSCAVYWPRRSRRLLFITTHSRHSFAPLISFPSSTKPETSSATHWPFCRHGRIK